MYNFWSFLKIHFKEITLVNTLAYATKNSGCVCSFSVVEVAELLNLSYLEMQKVFERLYPGRWFVYSPLLMTEIQLPFSRTDKTYSSV